MQLIYHKLELNKSYYIFCIIMTFFQILLYTVWEIV